MEYAARPDFGEYATLFESDGHIHLYYELLIFAITSAQVAHRPLLAELRHGNVSTMNQASRALILSFWLARPEEIRYLPASEDALGCFEKEFGPIPEDFRWFLGVCGGGVVGSEWVDGIEQLAVSHRRHLKEAVPGGWAAGFFLIGIDGAGSPFGIDRVTGAVVVESEGSGGEVRQISASIEHFLLKGLID